MLAQIRRHFKSEIGFFRFGRRYRRAGAGGRISRYIGRMNLLEKLRRFLPGGKPLIPREPIAYRAIGIVRNRVRESRPAGWEDVRSDIILRDELEPALDALEGFSHVIVVFHLNRVPEEARSLTIPVGNEEAPRGRGVLATRSQLRPNPIGVSVVPVLHRRKSVLRVRGLDALDGTPVLDIKPYLPSYDSVPDAKLPDWAVRREGP
jgi:tRNA-Thr(GGU) m(6)t(6)A37 methyltransferase TsaA